MVNQSLNEFYTWSLLKIDALPQDLVLLVDTAITFFNNLIPDAREILILE